MVYQLNIQMMPLTRRSHLIVTSPVAATAAWIWSITDAGWRPAHGNAGRSPQIPA